MIRPAARALTWLDPRGFGWCERCKISWRWAPWHEVRFTVVEDNEPVRHHAYFWLCERCWAKESVQGRLRLGTLAFNRLWDFHQYRNVWPLITYAVINGGDCPMIQRGTIATQASAEERSHRIPEP